MGRALLTMLFLPQARQELSHLDFPDALLSQLMGMLGISQTAARRALRETGGDLDRAVNYQLEQQQGSSASASPSRK